MVHEDNCTLGRAEAAGWLVAALALLATGPGSASAGTSRSTGMHGPVDRSERWIDVILRFLLTCGRPPREGYTSTPTTNPFMQEIVPSSSLSLVGLRASF